MRFVRVHTSDGPRIGVLGSNETVAVAAELTELEPCLGDGGATLLEAGTRILAAPAFEAPLSAVELLAPLRPVALRDFMAFEEHIAPYWRQSGLSRGPDVWYERPVGYQGTTATILGPRDAVPIPGGCTAFDFELEIGAIIDRDLGSVAPGDASDAIAGYVLLCDWSARDIQAREMQAQLGPFKGKDSATSLGPVFVTPDELAGRRTGKGYDLAMTSFVNNRQYGQDNWSSAYWSFEELLSYASWNSCVERGSVIGSGTCQGGCIFELSLRHSPEEFPWLAPGDQVRLEAGLLGAVSARILPPAAGPWPGLRTTETTAAGSA